MFTAYARLQVYRSFYPAGWRFDSYHRMGLQNFTGLSLYSFKKTSFSPAPSCVLKFFVFIRRPFPGSPTHLDIKGYSADGDFKKYLALVPQDGFDTQINFRPDFITPAGSGGKNPDKPLILKILLSLPPYFKKHDFS